MAKVDSMSPEQVRYMAEMAEIEHAALKMHLYLRATGWRYAGETDTRPVLQCQADIDDLVGKLRGREGEEEMLTNGQCFRQIGILAGIRMIDEGYEKVDLFIDIGSIYGGPCAEKPPENPA